MKEQFILNSIPIYTNRKIKIKPTSYDEYYTKIYKLKNKKTLN